MAGNEENDLDVRLAATLRCIHTCNNTGRFQCAFSVVGEVVQTTNEYRNLNFILALIIRSKNNRKLSKNAPINAHVNVALRGLVPEAETAAWKLMPFKTSKGLMENRLSFKNTTTF